MLAETNSRPDVQESYYSATSTSNLRVQPHRRTPADMILAAGMSRYDMGLSLLRLASEWDRSAKPTPMTAAQIEALARSLPVEPPEIVEDSYFGPLPQKSRPNPHAGSVREEAAGEVRYRLPRDIAEEKAARWHEHELKLLLQGLKSLPKVRAGLEHWIGCEQSPSIVAATLIWWLSPSCAVCSGVGKRVAKGTNRTTGQPCSSCKGTGERKLRYAGQGRRVLGYISECLKDARGSIGAKFKHQKTRERPQRPDLLVRVGERWRARDGRLWDILAADNPPEGHQLPEAVEVGGKPKRRTLLARLVTDREVKAIYYTNGHPWRTFRTGPTGNDLVDLLGPAP